MFQDKIKKLVSLLFEVGTLRKVPRAHQQTLLSQDLSDNIASHSFRTALIGYFLAEWLEADTNKVVKMCLLHDIEEARSGDQNWIHKKYIKSFEDEIRKEQLGGLEMTKELSLLSKEYDQRESLEAKIVKDADLLDQILLLREYEWQGNKEASDWLKHNQEGEQEKLMHTDLAKNLAKEAKTQRPSEWWQNIWTANRR